MEAGQPPIVTVLINQAPMMSCTTIVARHHSLVINLCVPLNCCARHHSLVINLCVPLNCCALVVSPCKMTRDTIGGYDTPLPSCHPLHMIPRRLYPVSKTFPKYVYGWACVAPAHLQPQPSKHMSCTSTIDSDTLLALLSHHISNPSTQHMLCKKWLMK